MGKKELEKNRAITIHHCANKKKVQEIKEYIDSVQGPMNVLKQEYINSLKSGSRLHKLKVSEQVIGKPDWLTGRQWKNLEMTVYNTFEGWLEIAVQKGRKIINEWIQERKLSDDEVHRLRKVNKSKMWWDVENGCLELIEAILHRHSFPVFGPQTTILVDSLTSDLELTGFTKRTRDLPTEHDWWLSVDIPGERMYKTRDQDTPDVIKGVKGSTIDIPVFLDPYYMGRAENAVEVTNLYQLTIEDDECLVIRRVLKEQAAEEYRDQGDDVGIDWGFNTLLSTSQGQLLGRDFGQRLREYDEKLIRLERSLKENGVPLKKSSRRKKLVKTIKKYIKNEIGRVFNNLSRENIRSLISEQLDFRFGGLSRKMNRMLSKSGRKAFKNKLKDLEESHGIKTEEVNPAYTSQECSKCHFVFDKNRSREVFECKFCGKKKHADLQASDNIVLRRSQDLDGYKFLPRKQVLALRDQEFMNLWGFHPDVVRERYGGSSSYPDDKNTGAFSLSTYSCASLIGSSF